MRVRDAYRLVLPIALVAGGMAAGGCASTSAPAGWLPSSADARTDPYGGWIDVYVEGGTSPHPRGTKATAGELIAMNADGLWVLPPSSTRVVFVPRETIRHAKVARHASGAGGPAAWVFLGTVSTVSHGGFLVLTAPLWLIGGSASVAAETHRAIDQYPGKGWAMLRAFARYPQGPPTDLETTEIRPRKSEGRHR